MIIEAVFENIDLKHKVGLSFERCQGLDYDSTISPTVIIVTFVT
jgi:hypothetical protein